MRVVVIILVITLALFFYGGTNFYIGRKIFQVLCFLFPQINLKIYAIIYIFFALSLLIGNMPMTSDVKRIMSWIGSYWMGIYAYLLMLFLIADFVIFLGGIVKIFPINPSLAFHFYTSLIVLLLTTGLVVYGRYNANQTNHVSYDINLKDKAKGTGMKIVLISDLHLGAVNSENRLPVIIKNINALKPDIVCIAGDIFNDDFHLIREPDNAIELFKSIKSTYGVYACLGNHDGGKTFNEMIRLLELSNIKLLNDEHIIIDGQIVLIGRVDPSPIGGFGDLKRKDIVDIIDSVDTDMVVVVMDHTPSKIDQYGKGIDLLLAGHTHQGQIFPFNLITKSVFTLDYGHYQKDSDSPHVIVTSGVNTWGMPLRIGTNNEIVCISISAGHDI